VKQSLLTIGQLIFIAVSVLVLVAVLMRDARADTEIRYLLKLRIYSVADGHTVRDSSYTAIIQVPGFATVGDCSFAGRWAVYSFRSRRDPSNVSVNLLDYECVKDHVKVDTD
jgi:hypothetical protein